MVKDELKKKPFEFEGPVVEARLEMSRQKKPLAKAHALFYKRLSAARDDESKINVIYDNLHTCFLIGKF